MRDSVAEVGIADSTFERVSAKAGVSRGLLHYYFGTKERLLVEVIRRDTEYRVGALVGAVRSATTVDEVIGAMFDAFSRTINEESGYVYMVSELFVAGRHRPEIQRELGSLYSRARGELAGVLREKQEEGVLALRFDAESVITHMFAAGDGAVLQLLTDPTLDAEAAGAASYQVYRFLLDSRPE
jgi:AcrR family transcriptional regulator